MNYTLKRSKKRKTFSVSILQENGKIVVYAPENASKEKIDGFLLSNKQWILNHLTAVKQRNELLPRLVSGEKILVCGKEYSIVVYDGKGLKVVDNQLYLPKGSELKGLKSFVKKEFLPYVQKKTKEFALIYNFKYGNVKISNCKKKWGSCAANNDISYSLGLAFLPEYLCNYVVLHELCHTKVKNHQKEFYQLFEKVLPNCRAYRKNLSNYSAFCYFLK